MCLSTVYMDSGNEQNVIMKDVAKIDAEGRGFWLTDLFGKKDFVEGAIKTINFEDGHCVILETGQTT